MADSPGQIPEQAATLPAAVSQALVPDHELLRSIGKGNYGEVWLARNKLGTFRAVKIVFEKSFRHKRPFEREFNGVRKFEPISRWHDGLVDILQVGGDDACGYFYCVMELADDVVSGQAIDPDRYTPRTLAADIARCKRLPVIECRRVGAAVAQALDFLHGRGLIHRDVKPSNIVFVNGVPKLADIGLVVEISEARSFVGTEGFIPPEGPGTAQADLYSLGKVLYEISTGKDRLDFPELPTVSDDPVEEAELSALNRTILKACRVDPANRYRSAKAMWADLVSLGKENSSQQRAGRKMMRIAIGALTAAGLVAALLLASGLESRTRPERGSAASDSEAGPRAEPQSLATGLVGYWAGEGNELDNAGGYDGEAPGGVGYASGQVGQAFLFDGVKAHVKIEAAPALDVGAADGFTLSAWINPTDVSVRGPLFEWNNGQGVYGVHFFIEPFSRLHQVKPGTLYANVEDTDHEWHTIISAEGVIVSNLFQHVVLTCDKRFKPNRSLATLYRNGVVVAREEFGRFTPLTRFDLYVGRRIAGEVAWHTSVFKGLIDEPAVFRRALSSNEVRILYEAGAAGRSALPKPTSVPAPSGLVSWWQAENNAADIVGGNNGVLMGGADYAAGRVGDAFSFSGTTNAYIEVPHSASLTITNEVTIEFWFRRQKPFASNYVVEKGGDWTEEALNYGVGVAGPKYDNRLFFAFAGGIRRSTGIDDVRWHHCAVTARNGDADPIFYIDGVPQPVTFRAEAEKIRLYPSTAKLHIGALVDPASPYSTFGAGTLDELSIYNRVLSASEIKGVYEAGRAGKTSFAKDVAGRALTLPSALPAHSR